jgi:hypothetical protein
VIGETGVGATARTGLKTPVVRDAAKVTKLPQETTVSVMIVGLPVRLK